MKKLHRLRVERVGIADGMRRIGESPHDLLQDLPDLGAPLPVSKKGPLVGNHGIPVFADKRADRCSMFRRERAGTLVNCLHAAGFLHHIHCRLVVGVPGVRHDQGEENSVNRAECAEDWP